MAVGFSGPVGMLNSPHVQMDESSSKKDIFILYRLIGRLTKLLSNFPWEVTSRCPGAKRHKMLATTSEAGAAASNAAWAGDLWLVDVQGESTDRNA